MKLNLDFFHPYWTGVKNMIPSKPVETLPPLLDKYVWFYCPDNHCKILSNRQPNCPICNSPTKQRD